MLKSVFDEYSEHEKGSGTMTASQKSTGRAKTMQGGLLYGWIIEMAITAIMIWGSSWACISGILPWEKIGYCVMAAVILPAYLGATLSYKKIKRRKALVSGISCAAYLATLAGLCMLLFGGEFGAWYVIVLLCILGAGIAFLNPESNRAEQRRRKKLG